MPDLSSLLPWFTLLISGTSATAAMMAVFASRKNAKISREIAAKTEVIRVEVNSRLSQLLSAKVGEAEAKGQRDVAESDRAAAVGKALAEGHAEGVEAERVRSDKILTLFVIITSAVAVLLTSGCSWHARKLFKVEEKIGERVKENIQIADESLNAQPEEHKTRQTDVASQAVHDAAVLSGYPLEDQRPLVAGLFSQNEKLRKSAEAAWAAKRKTDQKLRTVQMHQLRELQRLGSEVESERNQNIVTKSWRWLYSTLGIGGIVALCIFFPAVIPILGRILGWIVGLFPKLAGLIGVVSTKAVDKIVGSVELAKRNNSAARYAIEDTASRKMDEPEKALVRARKPIVMKEFAEEEKEKAEVEAEVTKIVEETAETVRVREAKLAGETKGSK